jgi:hypothetical protein
MTTVFSNRSRQRLPDRETILAEAPWTIERPDHVIVPVYGKVVENNTPRAYSPDVDRWRTIYGASDILVTGCEGPRISSVCSPHSSHDFNIQSFWAITSAPSKKIDSEKSILYPSDTSPVRTTLLRYFLSVIGSRHIPPHSAHSNLDDFANKVAIQLNDFIRPPDLGRTSFVTMNWTGTSHGL